MKTGVILFLILTAAVPSLAEEKKAPQACADEESMVADYQKGLTDLVGTVQKEKLDDFARAYHRRSCLSKLNLCESILDTATACFDDAIKDSSTPKASLEACRAKRDGYAKLRTKLIQYRDSLKAKEEDKEAKALIETFNMAN